MSGRDCQNWDEDRPIVRKTGFGGAFCPAQGLFLTLDDRWTMSDAGIVRSSEGSSNAFGLVRAGFRTVSDDRTIFLAV